MPHPIWVSDSRAALDAWTGIPDQLRALIQPDDDRDEIASTLDRFRFAGLDVLDPDVFALAVETARKQTGCPRPQLPTLYRAGELARRRQARSVVYYARVGNRVKIGYSIDATKRLAAINPEHIMATEPGGPQLEAQRHREFGQLRTHGEWFRLDEPLVGHIAALAAGT